MRVEAESIPEVVRLARTSSQLSKVAFAKAAGTTRAAIDEYEKGLRVPRADTLAKILAPAALQLTTTASPGLPQTTGRTLATFADGVDIDDPQWSWRTLVSDFVANEFAPALGAERLALVAGEPPSTESGEWDSFIAALGEHLCFHARVDPPAWFFGPARDVLDQWWWPVHGAIPSMRSAAFALSPAAFRRRRIAIDGRELPAIVP